MELRAGLRRAMKDVIAGGVFIFFGAAFALMSLEYELGTALQMGPGYVPFALGLVLVGLGMLVVVKGFLSDEEGAPMGTVPVRAIVLIIVAILFFGITVRGLGLAPSLAVTTFLAGLASEKVGVVTAGIIAIGLTALSVVIFVIALQLRLPLIGPWLGG